MISIELGLFPWINCAVLLAFLPAAFWSRAAALRIARRGDGLRAAAVRVAERIGGGRAGGRTRLARLGEWPLAARAQTALVSLLLLYVVVVNVNGVRQTLDLPEPVARLGHLLRLDQRWAMFTPNAARFDGWFVVPGTLANGDVVDLLGSGGEPSWEKPRLISATHDSYRWARYLWQLRNPETNLSLRVRYAAWLCREWNALHRGAERLVRVEMYFMDERTPEAYRQPTSVERRLLVRLRCGGRREALAGRRE